MYALMDAETGTIAALFGVLTVVVIAFLGIQLFTSALCSSSMQVRYAYSFMCSLMCRGWFPTKRGVRHGFDLLNFCPDCSSLHVRSADETLNRRRARALQRAQRRMWAERNRLRENAKIAAALWRRNVQVRKKLKRFNKPGVLGMSVGSAASTAQTATTTSVDNRSTSAATTTEPRKIATLFGSDLMVNKPDRALAGPGESHLDIGSTLGASKRDAGPRPITAFSQHKVVPLLPSAQELFALPTLGAESRRRLAKALSPVHAAIVHQEEDTSTAESEEQVVATLSLPVKVHPGSTNSNSAPASPARRTSLTAAGSQLSQASNASTSFSERPRRNSHKSSAVVPLLSPTIAPEDTTDDIIPLSKDCYKNELENVVRSELDASIKSSASVSIATDAQDNLALTSSQPTQSPFVIQSPPKQAGDTVASTVSVGSAAQLDSVNAAAAQPGVSQPTSSRPVMSIAHLPSFRRPDSSLPAQAGLGGMGQQQRPPRKMSLVLRKKKLEPIHPRQALDPIPDAPKTPGTAAAPNGVNRRASAGDQPNLKGGWDDAASGASSKPPVVLSPAMRNAIRNNAAPNASAVSMVSGTSFFSNGTGDPNCAFPVSADTPDSPGSSVYHPRRASLSRVAQGMMASNYSDGSVLNSADNSMFGSFAGMAASNASMGSTLRSYEEQSIASIGSDPSMISDAIKPQQESRSMGKRNSYVSMARKGFRRELTSSKLARFSLRGGQLGMKLGNGLSKFMSQRLAATSFRAHTYKSFKSHSGRESKQKKVSRVEIIRKKVQNSAPVLCASRVYSSLANCLRPLCDRCERVLESSYFDKIILLCIVVNSVSIASYYHNITPDHEALLQVSEFVFAWIFSAGSCPSLPYVDDCARDSIVANVLCWCTMYPQRWC